jgi:hypothetical protein
MFEWNWPSIAQECTDFLGPAGASPLPLSSPVVSSNFLQVMATFKVSMSMIAKEPFSIDTPASPPMEHLQGKRLFSSDQTRYLDVVYFPRQSMVDSLSGLREFIFPPLPTLMLAAACLLHSYLKPRHTRRIRQHGSYV